MKNQVSFSAPTVSSPLTEMFKDLQDSLNAFTLEAEELHKSTSVTDETSRALYTAFSRITAYSDQLHMIFSMLSEDVRVAEEIGTAPSPEFESAAHENCFYEWLRASRKGGAMVN